MRGPIALSTLLLVNSVACAPERGPNATALPLTNSSFDPSNDDGNNDDDDDDDTANDPSSNLPTEEDPNTSVPPMPTEDQGSSVPTNVTEDDPTNSTPTTVTDTDPPDDTTMPQTTVDDTTNPVECEPQSFEFTLDTPSVMLVLDKSGSMVAAPSGMNPGGYWDHDNNPGTPDQTRWKSLHQAISVMANTFNDSLDLGLSLFPAKDAKSAYDLTACPVYSPVEVPVGPNNASAVISTMPGADATSSIKGATPAAQAIKEAFIELLNADPNKPRYIVMVTDGAANCQEFAPNLEDLFEVYDENLPVNVFDAFDQGVPTYVVGIGIKNVTSSAMQDGNPDSTNAYEKLNEVAIAGGRPLPGADKFYDTQNQLELQAALEEIASDMIGCTIDLNPAPEFPDSVSISANGVDYDAVGNCATQDGWRFTNGNNDQIELCGAACEGYQVTGSVTADYQCPG